MMRLIVVLVLMCLAAAALGCGEDSASASGEDQGASLGSASSSSEGSDEGSGHDDDDGDSDEGSGHDDDSGHDDKTVSRENPGFTGTGFDSGRNDALVDAQPLDAVTWTVEPTISAGALEAKGVLKDGATLFNPVVDGEGAGFIVYFKGMGEPLALLLPDLGPTRIWETDHTVAPTEHEIEGASFEIRAYSPLFMDVGPSDLEIRLFGYDAGGADALLAVRPVTVP